MRGVDREAEFRRLFSEHYRRVLAYALRRCEQRADAEDVVAATFGVAWRRFADAPPEELRLAWLYAIAARVLANQRRSQRRLSALRSRLQAVPSAEAPERLDLAEVLVALRQLRPEEQEILRLTAWEGLTNAGLAIALGCSENAAAIRLHRARKHLARHIAKGIAGAGHSVVGGVE